MHAYNINDANRQTSWEKARSSPDGDVFCNHCNSAIYLTKFHTAAYASAILFYYSILFSFFFSPFFSLICIEKWLSAKISALFLYILCLDYLCVHIMHVPAVLICNPPFICLDNYMTGFIWPLFEVVYIDRLLCSQWEFYDTI